MSPPVTPRVAVISGGSSGIGLEVARLLRARGYDLHLLARDAVRLAQARDALAAEPGGAVTCHALDVSDEAASAAVIDDILAQAGRIDWLVTSAGAVEPGMFLDMPLEVHRRLMDINYFGTLHLVRPVAQHMTARGDGGRITLVSSAVAFGAVVGYGAYAPGKFAVHALGETLAMELKSHRVTVSVAFPPDTDTPQLAAETPLRPPATQRIAAGGGLARAQDVARSLVEGAERGRFLIVPGVWMSAYGWFHSVLAPLLRARQISVMEKLSQR